MVSDSSFLPPDVDITGILASNAVSGSAWGTNARLTNHLLGRGRVLVPPFKPSTGGTLGDGSYTFAFRLVPTYNALARRWRVSARCGGDVVVTANGVTLSPTAPGTFESIEQYELPPPIIREELLSSQSNSESSATVTVSASAVGDGGGSVDIDSIECIEIPRRVLAEDANERGVNLPSMRTGQPLRADAFANMLGVSQDADIGKRVLLHWAVPYLVGGVASNSYAASTSSSAFVSVFPVNHFALARKIYNDGADTTNCKARFFAWVSGGGSGQIRVSGTKGNSSAVTITNTTASWSSQITNAPVVAEDLAAPDGEGGAGHDALNVQIRATSGTIYLASAIVYE
jgi:hypothetical protein